MIVVGHFALKQLASEQWRISRRVFELQRFKRKGRAPPQSPVSPAAPDDVMLLPKLGNFVTYIRLCPLRVCSSTNRRIAEDRLPCARFSSIFATNADSVAC